MSDDCELLFAQAFEMQRNNQLPQAISLYEQLLAINPQYAQAYHFLGLVYALLGDMQAAITNLKKASQLEPRNPSYHNNLANAFKKMHQTEQAILSYQQALKLSPDYAQAHHNLATVYADQTNYNEALYHYRAAIHAEPDFAAAHFNLGLLLLKNNQFDAAKKQFNNVLVLNPGNINAEFYLGILNLEANEINQAEIHFQNVLLADNNHIQAITNLGVIALKREQGQLAVDYFTKALLIDNNYTEARNNLAATFMHYDRFENALMHYDVLLKQDPQNSEYLYNSGVAQMALGHLTEAIAYFETLLNEESNHFAALNNLAAIYIRLDDREQAKNLLNRALAAKPDDAASRHMLNALTQKTLVAENSPEYAMNLFNNYALYYDQHMQGLLQYSLPQHIARVLHKFHVLHVENTLDLGCGTGLTGLILREISDVLIGVDISAKMLNQAKAKNIYNQLVEKELITFLQHDKQRYDLVVAADVFPYLGELDSFFAALKLNLQPQAYFLFTIEISKTEPWLLQPTARFSHNPNYIRELCNQYELEIIHQEQLIARQQDKQALAEILFFVQQKIE